MINLNIATNFKKINLQIIIQVRALKQETNQNPIQMKKVTTNHKNIVTFTENVITQPLSVRSFKSIKPNIKVSLVTKIILKIMSN
jgi:hypothetical protein